MRNIKTLPVVLALMVGIPTLVALRTSDADETTPSSNHFRVTVTSVIGNGDSVVKQIRIEAKPGSHAKITSDKKGGGGLSALAGSVDNGPGKGVITVTVLADHVEWKAGDVNALKFLMSIEGNGSKALMSDTGPMVADKRLSDLFAVSLKSGTYDCDTEIPILRFNDKTFSLTVTAQP
ncbi:hypothetical protein [Roseimaritima ulvae]|uniref:Uncharacterized protein n=1 Tax=Roseimaritima ulvae TaxID=980254 RepID=A0A5B9QSY3_9BACT|nr:hypothetical protein [Roseimaritima ulvae]QEG40176.1 hypothetical protein UC8_21820 [Roseimaritima ulvae]